MAEQTHDQAALGKLPVFFELSGRLCVLAGDNDDALPKARLLLSAGARLALFMAEPGEELTALCAAHQARTELHTRPCRRQDLEQAMLAIGAFADEHAATAFAELARTARVPLNMVDRPALCDFQIPSIVNRSPLIVGISTGGIAPVIGQWLRGRIETLLPPDTGHILTIAARLRAAVLERLPALQVRRRFWRSVAEDELPHLGGQDEERILSRLEACLARIEAEDEAAGSVRLIIAPENPDLLRLGQLRALQNADLVISLGGADPLYLDFVRRDAGRLAADEPDQAVAEALAAAAAGRSVIWLAGPEAPGEEALARASAKRGISLLRGE